MRFMKKFLAVTAAATMVLTAAGCQAKAKTPQEIYQEAQEKNKELKSLDCDVAFTMSMKQGEETLDMSGTMDMKMAGMNTEDMKYSAATTLDLLGQQIGMDVYYTDGYYYTEMMGQKMKYAMDLDEMIKQIESTTNNYMDVDYLQDLTAEKDGDNTVLKYTADPAKTQEYVKEAMASMGTSGLGLDQTEFTINSISGEATINKEGYYTAQNVNMDLLMSIMGQEINMVMDMEMTYNTPGQEVTVELPEDMDSYMEIELPETQAAETAAETAAAAETTAAN